MTLVLNLTKGLNNALNQNSLYRGKRGTEHGKGM